MKRGIVKQRRGMALVQCGTLRWRGLAASENEAIMAALSKRPPKSPGMLLRVHCGKVWKYIDFIQAMRIAGYKMVKTKRGFMVG